ncbi:MAG: hypothetical protein AAF957_02865 [Planctomycetota bacterium]
MRAWIAATSAFLIGFAATNRALVSRVPLPAEAGLRSKVEYVRAHADDFDVLLVGSSATLYGVRPDVFEEELARLGHPGVRSFNLGVGGMGSFEAAQVLEGVLSERPARLAWVLYEEPLFDPLLWYPDVYNPRYVHWHDLRTTVDAIGAVALADAPPPYKVDEYAADWLGRFDWRLALAAEHLGLFGWRATALGEGPDLARRWTARDADPLWPSRSELERDRGWMDISLDPEEGARRAHEKFREDPAAWRARVDAIRASADERPALEGTYDVASLRGLLAAIRGAGAEPLVYVAPRGLPSPLMASLRDAGELDALLEFHLPSRYPRLAEEALRWDASHLNAEGATEWSRAFAAAFAAHLDATGRSARRTPSR